MYTNGGLSNGAMQLHHIDRLSLLVFSCHDTCLSCGVQGVCHGRSTVPTIACVSLYKWSGVMQFNGLVLSGFVPALVKALIEYLQLSTASECAIQTGAWDIIERVNIFLGRYLFVPRNLELE